MARIRRNANLSTREARRELQARPEPYFMVLEPGLLLGYRKSREGGKWLVSRLLKMPPDPKHKAPWHTRRERPAGLADDFRDADGTEVLTFAQAQRKALSEATQAALRASGQLYTVAEAIDDYLEYQRTYRKSSSQTESKLKAYVASHLGSRIVAELKPADFEEWLKWALRRRRKRKDAAATERPAAMVEPPADDSERLRRRKATLNRVIVALKACLNYAYSSHRVPSREAWARLRKYPAADSARLRWLTVEEATRLQNACPPDLRTLVRAALLTGCRAGELLALRGSDFDDRSETLLIADSKSGKPRRVPLTAEGVALFEELTAGLSDDLVFTRADGSRWYRLAIARAMHVACTAAKIAPPATFHTLRHTYASHLVQEGVPLLFVAAALGHRDARMVEKHYGHLAPSHVHDLIREKLPTFNSPRKSKVRRLHSRARRKARS